MSASAAVSGNGNGNNQDKRSLQNKSAEINSAIDEDDPSYASMFRITAGLPRYELTLMAKEARECEAALAKEIRILEVAAGLPTTQFPPGVIDEEESQGKKIGVSVKEMNGVDTALRTVDDSSVISGGAVGTGVPTHGAMSSTSNTNNQQDRNNNNSSIGTNTNDKPNTNNAVHQNPASTIPSAYDPMTVGPNYLTSADAILASKDLTPLDRYFTVSALLGRIRPPLDTPPPPHSNLAIARGRATAAVEKKKLASQKKSGDGVGGASTNFGHQKQLDKYKRLIRLRTHNEIYTRRNTNTASAAATHNVSGVSAATATINNTTALLALWKRISNHRTAAVFRRAVNAKEAPGYNDRIPFPIDLSLIKKMIACGQIDSFYELHQRIGLICHNCVKFNGRESDYALLTRDFESYVDDSFLDVLQKLKDRAAGGGGGGGGKK